MRLYYVSVDRLPAVIESIQSSFTCSANSYTPAPAETRQFEVHKRYIDIQFLESGEELVHITHGKPEPGNFDEGKDCGFYPKGMEPDATVRLRPGFFCVIFPGEAHMPNVASTKAPTPVDKRVAKVSAEAFEQDPLLFDRIFNE